jgi:WD40 repeat protein
MDARGEAVVIEQPYRYWAFISYSHHDLRAAVQLHRWLERYVVPRRLVGRASPTGPLPRRLAPIFRDRDELPSSAELGGVINQALSESRYLIVICSPRSAASRWVNEEIRQFRALGGSDRILALIVDGDPASSDPAQQCFPPAMRWDADSASPRAVEPIAADLRRGGDGEYKARMKLVAGLLDVGLDELLRRERRRELQQRLGWTAGIAAVLALAASLLLLQQRQFSAREHAETVARLLENGRQELLAGAQMRAAVYLSEAYRDGIDTPALRFMLRQAMQPIDALTQVIDTGAPLRGMELSRDDHTLVSLSTAGGLGVWSLPAGNKLAQIQAFDFAASQAYCGPALSDDGRRLMIAYLAIGSENAVLQAWSLPDGARLLEVPISGNNCTTAVPFTPDGSRVAAVATDGRPALWPLDGGSPWMADIGETGPATVASLSRDGRWLAAGHRDGRVSLWVPGAAKPALILSGLDQTVTSVDFHADGDLLVASGTDGAMRGWSLPDGHIAFAGGHAQPIYQLQLASEAKRVLSQGPDGERVWRTDNGSLVYAGSGGSQFTYSSLRADGQQLGRVEFSQAVVTDVISSKPLFTINGDTLAVQFSRGGSQLLTADSNGHVALWKEGFRPLASRWHGARRGELPVWWSPSVRAVQLKDGRVLSGGPDGRLLLWEPRQLAALGALGDLGSAIWAVSASADGRFAAAAAVSGDIGVWDLASGRELHRLPLRGQLIPLLKISPGGEYLFAADRGNRGHLWRIGDGKLLAEYAMDSRAAVDFSPDSAQLAIGIGHRVQLLRLATLSGEFSEPLSAEAPPIGCIRFAPTGALVAMADDVSGVARWMGLPGGERRQLKLSGVVDGCVGAEFDRSGAQVLLMHGGAAVSLWTPEHNRVAKVGLHNGVIFDAHWSPDDRFIVTAGTDGVVQVADSGSGQMLQNLGFHAGQIGSVRFSADGATLYSGGEDGRLQAWESGLETRAPAEIAARVGCVSPWRLEGGSLKPQPVKLAACVAGAAQ